MKAMILAAGRGERMGALTATTPKPLLEVAGKPLLAHHIERLRAAGVTEIVINTSYLGAQIRDYVGSGDKWQLKIVCTSEPERLETAGGIINALPLLGADPFLVVNGDIWLDFPLTQLPGSLSGLAHLVLVDNPPHHPEGDFGFDAATGKLKEESPIRLTFSGLSVLSPLLFADCHPGKQPLAPLLRQAIACGKVTGEHYRGRWIDVGTPERLQQVATLIRAELNHT